MPERMGRREAVSTIAGMTALLLTSPREVLGAITPETIDPRTLQYGFARDGVPQHAAPDGRRLRATYRSGALIRYIDAGSDWVETIPDRFASGPQTPQHSGIFIPKSYLETVTHAHLSPFPLQVGEKRWVEISIDQQRVWAYSQIGDNTPEEKWFAKVTTGKNRYGTEIGNHITYRTRWARLMSGADYYLPYVPLPVYFYRSGQAIHSAYWRTSFGEQDFRWNGSHGCVNTEEDTAKFMKRFIGPQLTDMSIDEVYASRTNPGTPVYVRYDKPNIRPG